MNAQYQNLPLGGDQSNSLPITADAVLAAARRHEKYLRTVSPRDYRMRVFEDGGVAFSSRVNSGLDRTFTLEEIQKAVPDFRLSPHRSLERHLFKMWD